MYGGNCRLHSYAEHAYDNSAYTIGIFSELIVE
jgi:hypothetical protein